MSTLIVDVPGIWIYWSVPSRRQSTLAVIAAGSVVTIVVAVVSSIILCKEAKLTQADGSQTGSQTPNADRRREQLLEVLVFLFLIGPSMLLATVAFQHENATFRFVAWAVMLRDLALVCLILFFIWRNGEPRELIGLTLRNAWKEFGLGVALYVPFFFLAFAVDLGFRRAGLSTPSGPAPTFLTPKGTAESVLALLLVVVVAISEETMFRGYLITRLRAITGSLAGSLILSAAIFSVGHGYEGSAGMATVGVMGLVFGLVFVWRRSLLAPMTMHFIQDFIGIVLAPLLGLK